jgi:hypothetical protein
MGASRIGIAAPTLTLPRLRKGGDMRGRSPNQFTFKFSFFSTFSLRAISTRMYASY